MGELKGRREALTADIAEYSLKYPEAPMESVILTFYGTLSGDDRAFFEGCWGLCADAAEEAREAPESVKRLIRAGGGGPEV